jgi:hypothetical protein
MPDIGFSSGFILAQFSSLKKAIEGRYAKLKIEGAITDNPDESGFSIMPSHKSRGRTRKHGPLLVRGHSMNGEGYRWTTVRGKLHLTSSSRGVDGTEKRETDSVERMYITSIAPGSA